MTLLQQQEKSSNNSCSFINPLDIVHRSCVLPPLVFVFLIAYEFDVRPPRCFCQLAFFPLRVFATAI